MNTKVSKTPTHSTASSLGAASGDNKKQGGGWLKGLVTLIVVLIIIGGGIYLISSYTGIGAGIIPGTTSFNADWQAVFLTNGQVYFGKVAKITGDSITLQEIYYLQVVNRPLQRSAEGEGIAGEQETEQRLTLIKLGNEIHGPQDEMVINRDHVILMEDLKDDSRVVLAINDYVNQAAQD